VFVERGVEHNTAPDVEALGKQLEPTERQIKFWRPPGSALSSGMRTHRPG